MPKKKKDYVPKDMEDLEKIFYGPKKDGRNVDRYRQRRYLDLLRTQVMSPAFEGEVKAMFASLGKIEKIPENQKRTNFDYKIDDRRLLLEVTSLNIDEAYPTNLTREETLKKLKVAIDHILTKDASPFPGYRKGGVIIYTLIFNFFSKFDKLLDDKLPEISGMLDNNLDFLVFFLQPASIIVAPAHSSWKPSPPVLYIKDGLLAEEFKKAFQGQNYKFVVTR